MTAAPPRDPDLVSRWVDDAARGRRAEACAALSPPLLVALAGAPRWPPPALAALGLWPPEAERLTAPLVRRAGRGDDQIVELDADALPAIRAELDRRGVAGEVVALVRDLGRRLATIELDLPPVLTAWADLARRLDDGARAVADHVVASVRDACDRGRPGASLDLLEAAAALDHLIEGPLPAAVRIGHHRVELAQRTARDRRQLLSFVPRREAQDAIDALLDDDQRWALHLLGVGGVGKTTLLRHLTVDLAEQRGLTVARVDFDYLSPRYPGTDPGRLVEAIVAELTVRIDRQQQDGWLQQIKGQLVALRQWALEADTDDPLAAFLWPPFQELLSYLESLLNSLPRPVVVLDTCEELMKLAPVAGRVPSVEATFRLIEELHRRCKALRVLFAGRRLLAEGGAGWQAPPQPIGRALTAPRDYLALCELRGFTADEARAALARRLPAARRDDAALIDAILAASPEDERVTDAVSTTSDAPRYSPFRVGAFGAWVAAEPTLDAAALATGGDPYIEHRIVRRMGELEPLLPAVALLRRFDAATFTAVVGDADGLAAFEALAGHEWLDVTHDPQRGAVLTAKRSVAIPLERYLAHARPEAWAAARRQIAAALAVRLPAAAAALRIGGPDAQELPPEVVDALLRALPAEEAVAAWAGFETALGGAWAPALTLTTFLLGERAAGEDPATLLGAAIRATRASALIHTQPSVDVGPLWDEVARGATALDGAAARTAGAAAPWLLALRARLGAVAAAAWRDTGDLDEQLAEVERAIGEIVRFDHLAALRGPVIAAVEAVLERAERSGAALPDALVAAVRGLAPPATDGEGGDGVAAMVAALTARALHLSPEADAAERAAAWRKVPLPPPARLPADLLDWLPPASLAARLQLELLRFGFVDPAAVTDHPDRLLAPPPADAGDVDSEHLRAALGLYDEARGRGAVGTLPTGLAPPRRYGAYQRFPSGGYQIALARDGRLSVDEAVDGRALILDRLDLVERAAFAMDDRVLAPLRGADVVLFRIDHARAEAVAGGDAMPLGALLAAKVDVVAAWPVVATPTATEIEQTMAAVRPHLPALRQRAGQGPIADRLGAIAVLEQATELSRFTAEPLADPRAALPDLAREPIHPDAIDDVVRGALVAVAAGQLAYPPDDPVRPSAGAWLAAYARAVPRRFAQLAHEQGQLLALRLPDRGLRLLTLAAEAYDGCGDAVGATAARLAGDVARRRLGQPLEVDGAAALAALPDPDAALLRPLVERLASTTDHLTARFERGRRRAPSTRVKVAGWWSRHASDVVVWTIVVLVFAVIVVGVIGALVWLAPWLVRTLRANGVAVPRYVGGLGTWVAFAYVGYKALAAPVAWVRRWRRRRRVRGLAVTGAVRRTAQAAELELRTTDGLAVTFEVDPPAVGRPPRLGGRREGDLPAELAPLLQRVAGAIDKVGDHRAVPMVLAVDDALAAPAWEALLGGAHPLVRECYAVQRTVTVRQPPARERKAGAVRASPAHRALVGAGLAGPGIVHAIGRPAQAGHALGLALGGASDATAPLTIGQVAAPDTTLVILQGAPEAASETVTDAYRTEVGKLRQLAVALIASGVAEVIVIPPVPEATVRALAALDPTDARLDTAFGGRGDRLALAQLIRDHLYGVDDDAHRAAALEVTHLVAVTAAPVVVADPGARWPARPESRRGIDYGPGKH